MTSQSICGCAVALILALLGNITSHKSITRRDCARAVDLRGQVFIRGGGAKFEIKHKTALLKIVSWLIRGAKHVD